MKKICKGMALALCMVLFFSQMVFADSVDISGKTYVSLGADLRENEKQKVLSLLGIDNINDYKVDYITNKMEHEYLDEYLDASVIGTRALSSVIVKPGSDGIDVKTYNIGFCTSGMYRNALATAGMENAQVVVAGPFKISGTAALVGAMKAYESMTGETVSESNLDAANQELVVTGNVAQEVGSEKAEQLIALIKEKVASEDVSSKEDIMEIIDQAAQELDITLSAENRQKIMKLMKKIGTLDLDVNKLKQQAKDVYGKLSDLGISLEKQGFFEKLKRFFLSLFGR